MHTDPQPNTLTAKATAVVFACMFITLLVVLIARPVPLQTHAATEPIAYKLNPNTADRAALCLLPDIGPPTAQKIIDNRSVHGPFTSATDLQRVKGIGPKTAAAIDPWVTYATPNE